MKNNQVLSLKNLSKRFGSVVANNSVNIELYRGEVLSLLGENGAGKTTLMNMLFGHYLPDSGSIDVLGNDGQMRKLVLGHPQASLDAGIGMVHQHFTLAENLTVLDNILLGSEKLWAWRHDRNKARNKILKIIDRTGLSAPLDEKVARLTVGERQRVEILKALYHEVKILVLDEPTAVLTPQEADALFENINSMTKDGLSVIFISHKLREVLKFSNRIAVLRHGEKVGEIATSDANERVIARMMVGEETIKNPRDKIQLGNPILQLNEVSVKGDSMRTSLNRTNFTIHENEIVGIAGVSGNGQSVLAKLISGLIDPDSGELLIEGENVEYFSPNGMQSLGVGRIPEDRHHDGVVGAMSVAENLVIERLQDRDVNKNGFLQNRAIKENAEALIEKYDIRGPGIDAKASLLSGGNIQKLILARVFECKPNVILANQPTRGLDLGAANEVARHLLEARGRGAGVLLISEDLDEILALSDRIMVIHNGSLIETVNKDREVIGLMMAGEENMIRIEPREMPSKWWTVGIPIMSALVAILLAAIPLALAGANIFEAYTQMAKGIFGSTFAFTEMLTRATPLIFTGLAATIAFRAKLWNIGAEGQLYLGAMAAVTVGTGLIDAPSFILIPVILFAGAISGAVGMAAPTYLKTRFGADEVVTTLLLNFIIIIFLQMMLEGPLKDPMGMGWPQSEPILENGILPQLIPRMRIHSGLIIALISAGLVHLLLSKSIWGFKIRAVGENAPAALHAGINVNRTFMGAAVVSGAIAGLAGVSEVAGLRGYLTTDLSPGFGYTGIVVAMLAGLSPIGVVISAIFIASIFVGADTMSRAIGVSSYLADLVVAISLICVLIGGFVARYRFIRTNKVNA